MIIYYEKVIKYKNVWIFSYLFLDKYTDIIEYSNYSIVKDILLKYNILRIETIYSKERVIKHFYFLLKRLIQRSRMYAEIYGSVYKFLIISINSIALYISILVIGLISIIPLKSFLKLFVISGDSPRIRWL